MPYQTNEQSVHSAVEKISELKAAYMAALQIVVSANEQNPSAVTVQLILDTHQAALAYFNFAETFVGNSGLLGAHKNALWVNGFAEDCHAILESAVNHYKFLNSYSDLLGNIKDELAPSATSYANMQRMVKMYLSSDVCDTLLKKFDQLNLPKYGFKNEVKDIMGKKSQAILSFIFGVLFIITIIVIAIFYPSPTSFQILVFRVVLALAGAGIGAVLPGFIEVNAGKWLRAGGALAVFALIYFWNPASLVTNVEDQKMPSIPQPK